MKIKRIQKIENRKRKKRKGKKTEWDKKRLTKWVTILTLVPENIDLSIYVRGDQLGWFEWPTDWLINCIIIYGLPSGRLQGQTTSTYLYLWGQRKEKHIYIRKGGERWGGEGRTFYVLSLPLRFGSIWPSPHVILLS